MSWWRSSTPGSTTIDVTGWGIDDAVTIGQVPVRARIPEDFDASCGTASAYIMRVAHVAITSGTFDASADIDRWVTESVPLAGGAPETPWVAGLDPDSTWTFALETHDEVPSAISNGPGIAPAAGTRLAPDLGHTPYSAISTRTPAIRTPS